MITLENVSKSYAKGQPALNDVSLHIDKGEFVFIVGNSGSGKSTLLHILGSVDKPTEGRVVVEGRDISSLSPAQSAIFRRRKVGLVYQKQPCIQYIHHGGRFYIQFVFIFSVQHVL